MATVAAVAEEHSAAIKALPKNGVAIFPADSEFADVWRLAAAGRKTLDFMLLSGSHSGEASVTGRLLNDGQVQIQTELGAIEVRLNTLGSHNVRNALAACAVALAAGVSLEKIKQGLEAFLPVNGRMQSKHRDVNYTLIDDSYNANPDSVRAAIEALKQSGDRSWLILGDMGEVGDQGPEFHAEVGRYARERGIEHLLTHGTLAALSAQAHGQAHHHDSFEGLCREADRLLASVSSVLVKGSRFMKMERVVRHLQMNQEKTTC